MSLVTLLIAVVLPVSACVEPAQPTSAPAQPTAAGAVGPIKIGAIYNLTGVQAPLDAPSANGARLAIKEINAGGGVLGRQLELVLVDGKTDAATIANASSELIEFDQVVAMLGFSDTDQTLAVAPIAAKGAKNTYFTTHALMDAALGSDAVKKFIAAYQAEFKVPPENAFAGLGYDAERGHQFGRLFRYSPMALAASMA